jgi:SPP1 gp7 family putative phage head morphogenesis protein
MDEQSPELKGLVSDILNKFLNYIASAPLKDFVYSRVEKEYRRGLEAGEINFNMNFTPSYETVSFIQKYAFDNVTKLTDDLKDNLRKELAMGLMNGEGIGALKLRVMDVMETTISRAEMITRTETVRAFNMGNYQAARDSGLELRKQWSTHEDEKTCAVCGQLDNQVIDYDAKFRTSKGEEFLLSPAHPNCRCRVLYVQNHVRNNI